MRNPKIRPWIIVFAAFLIGFSSIGLGTNGLSLFYIPVTDDLGFSQTAFTTYFTITLLSCAVTSPIIGRIFTKHTDKMRLVMACAAVVTAACFFAYSRCNTLIAFYAVSVVRGVCNGILGNTSATIVANNWFHKKRGFAVSLVFMGSSAGGMFFTELSRAFLENYGWRTSYWALGLVGLAINVIMLLLIQPLPEKENMLPYGYDGTATVASEIPKEGMMFGKAIKTPAFWMLLVAVLMGSITVQGTQQAVTNSLQIDYGHTMQFASTVVSIFMIGICVGKLLLGLIYDKKGFAFGTVYICALLVLSYICILMGGNAVFAIAFGVLFGVGNMLATIMPTNATTMIFGTKDYGTIFGFIQMGVSGGCAIGPVVSAAIFDATGTYRFIWILYSVMVILTTALVISAKAITDRKRRTALTDAGKAA